MTTSLSRNLLSIHSLHSNPFPSTQPQALSASRNFSARLKTVTKSSSSPQEKTKTTPLEASPPTKPQQQQQLPREQLSSAKSSSVYTLLNRFRYGFTLDDVGTEILSIALPAALALAADPITSLVDTAFVGHIGSVELAAVGVSVSVFNLVSKLLNVPLLNVTTSFVAEEQALICEGENGSSSNGDDFVSERQGKRVLPSVSTSLALAAAVGVVEAVALSVGSGFLLNIMGIPVDSPMREPAERFLTWRAFGAPPIVIALAAQVAGNLLNAILDPILIFFCGFGIGGAAVATVISEYLIAFVLLWELNGKVQLASPDVDAGRLVQYLNSGKFLIRFIVTATGGDNSAFNVLGNSIMETLMTSGGLLIGRSIAVLLTTTLATSLAAREGPVHMAGHQICMEVWLTISLLNDALALAGQALLATAYGQGNYGQADQVIFRVVQIGLVTGIALAIILSLGFGAFASLFSTDPEVLKIAWSGVLFVAGSQPVNALAFVLDGLYYGVSDFGFAAYSMVLVGLISSVFLLVATPTFGLAGVWSGLFLFMTLRVVAGVWRLGTRSGPWKMVLANLEQKGDRDSNFTEAANKLSKIINKLPELSQRSILVGCWNQRQVSRLQMVLGMQYKTTDAEDQLMDASCENNIRNH
ncbi:Protein DETOXIFICATION 44, chloroplastic [Turnera subulata]|uniref:Protein DETOXIFICATION n=1 Tax=Turnera subulata TaxID=218843 RepID=A0A9Q0JIC6_9ROSI|nr:Protein DETOXIFICATION 44, chloroplastic [Turnera subulata]